jgi:hypothetical protein
MKSTGVLYLTSCASSGADRVPDFVKLAQEAGWDVCVITAPQGTKFIDLPLLISNDVTSIMI